MSGDVDLSGVGLGAIVLAKVGNQHRRLFLRTSSEGLPWIAANGDPWWCEDTDLADVEVLHPGVHLNRPVPANPCGCGCDAPTP